MALCYEPAQEGVERVRGNILLGPEELRAELVKPAHQNQDGKPLSLVLSFQSLLLTNRNIMLVGKRKIFNRPISSLQTRQ